MGYMIEFGIFIALICYFLSQLQKANQKIGRAYRDGFRDACNMNEPNYDYLSPLNSEMIKDRIELGLSTGFNYRTTKLYTYGWTSAKESIDNVISNNARAFESVGLQIHSLDELFTFYTTYNNKHLNG